MGDITNFAKLLFTTRGLNQQTIGNLHPIVVRILWEYIHLTIKNRDLSCNGAFFEAATK